MVSSVNTKVRTIKVKIVLESEKTVFRKISFQVRVSVHGWERLGTRVLNTREKKIYSINVVITHNAGIISFNYAIGIYNKDILQQINFN